MDHSHHHHSAEINLNNAFKTGIALNVLFILVELLFGYFSNSMALIADAGHNLSDVLTLIFSWIAIVLSQRKPTLKFTYGFRRSTILVALLNTVLLLIAVGFIIWETIDRLSNPVLINSTEVIIIAATGIVINGFTAWMFLKSRKHDLNIRSAFIHFFADALVSTGVVVGGIVMAFSGILWIDSLLSFIITVVILYSTYHLLIDSINLALDAVPENIDISMVKEYLLNLPEVSGIHDLHIWSLSTTETALTVHLNTNSPTGFPFISAIQHDLEKKFEVGHATIQVEYGTDITECSTDCSK